MRNIVVNSFQLASMLTETYLCKYIFEAVRLVWLDSLNWSITTDTDFDSSSCFSFSSNFKIEGVKFGHYYFRSIWLKRFLEFELVCYIRNQLINHFYFDVTCFKQLLHAHRPQIFRRSQIENNIKCVSMIKNIQTPIFMPVDFYGHSSFIIAYRIALHIVVARCWRTVATFQHICCRRLVPPRQASAHADGFIARRKSGFAMQVFCPMRRSRVLWAAWIASYI